MNELTRLARTSEAVVDLTKSRSPTVDDFNTSARKIKRSSRGSPTEKETPATKIKKSEAPTSTSSSKGVPQVVIRLKPRTSASANIELDQEAFDDNERAGTSRGQDVASDDLEEEDVMDMYTNHDQPEHDFMDDHSEEPLSVELEVAPTNKRSAPASSPPADQAANGRQKRVRIDTTAASIDPPVDSLDKSTNRVRQNEATSSRPQEVLTSAKKIAKVGKSLGSVPVPSPAQFRALLPNTMTDSPQSTSSTGPGLSQPDPIQQFSSPVRDSLNKSKIAVKAGSSNLAKGVQTRIVNGEEVLAVDSDSGDEGGEVAQERTQDVLMDTETVDEILAPVEVCSLVDKWGCRLM
jgi:hypothetical protein